MVDTADLSLEQAPPISVPFRFFLTAPLFGIAAGLLVAMHGTDLLASRWLPLNLALTHLLTLGFLSLIMVGAITQMLPVLAGSPLPAALPVGTSVHLALTGGALCMAPGFILGDRPLLLTAVCLLAVGFILFLGAAGLALARVRSPSATITGMRLAVASLGITLAVGALVALGLSGVSNIASPGEWTDLHLTWGLLGWFALLLIAVSYQVVPMFQVTPEYPAAMRRWLAPGLWGGLLAWSLVYAGVMTGRLPSLAADLVLAALILAVSLFALATLWLQRRRRRRVPDVTLAFWRVGLTAIILSSLLWVLAQWIDPIRQSAAYPAILGGGILVGAGVSLTNGMLYKIIPFLSWFHLQNRQLARNAFSVNLPNMKGFVPDAAAFRQYRFHLAACACGLLGVVWPTPFIPLFGGLFALSNAVLLVNLASAVLRYRRVFREIEAAGRANP